MKPTLSPGLTAEITATVTEDMCPAFDGIVTPATGLGLGIRDRLKTAGIEMAME